MKKIFATATLGALALSSCKKDHTCSCTASNANYNYAYTTNSKKKAAQEACDTYEASYASAYPGGQCELK
jgi:hypothetical protein